MQKFMTTILKIAIFIFNIYYSTCVIEKIIVYGGIYYCGCLSASCLINYAQPSLLNENLDEENYTLCSIYHLSYTVVK